LTRLPFTLALAGLLLAVPATAQDEPAMSRIFPYETHVQTLDNGLSVILVPMSSEGLVAYWSIVRTGSRDEYEPGHTGFAHFFEHMMFRGTEKYPAEAYNRIITGMGADANAFTTDDLTAYHLSIAAEDLKKVMEIESDRFMNLSYPEPAFRTEAGAVYGEYRKNRMSPFFTIWEALHEKAYDVHTYGHTTIGYEDDIKAMPGMFDYSRSFFSRYYRPDNVVILIAGDIEAEPTMKLIQRYYGSWEPGYVAPKIEPEPPQKEERRVDVSYEGRSLPILMVAYKAAAFAPDDPTYAASNLLAELAFGETSELYKRLVLKEQVVESLGAEAPMNRDAGLFMVYAEVKDPEKIDYVLDQVDATVTAFRETPPEATRVADLKAHLRYGFLMALDTPAHVARSLARIIAITGGIEAVDRLYTTFDSLTPQDVVTAAGAYLDPRRRTVAVLEATQ
jgi:zinc protease